jgi:hypothetical protein
VLRARSVPLSPHNSAALKTKAHLGSNLGLGSASIIIIHGFFIRFLIKETQNDRHKKNHAFNLDKLIWTCQNDWVVNLDPIILIGSVAHKMIIYLINRQWTI